MDCVFFLSVMAAIAHTDSALSVDNSGFNQVRQHPLLGRMTSISRADRKCAANVPVYAITIARTKKLYLDYLRLRACNATTTHTSPHIEILCRAHRINILIEHLQQCARCVIKHARGRERRS